MREDLLDYAPVAKENFARSSTKGAMSVAEMCKAAVELSDNTCANLLLAKGRRPGSADRVLALEAETRSRASTITSRSLIVRRPAIPRIRRRPPPWQAICAAFCSAMILSQGSRERLTGWMLDCRTRNNRLRAGLPESWRVGDKTGNNGKDAAGDIAVAWPKSGGPTLICAYTQGGSPTAPHSKQFSPKSAGWSAGNWASA